MVRPCDQPRPSFLLTIRLPRMKQKSAHWHLFYLGADKRRNFSVPILGNLKKADSYVQILFCSILFRSFFFFLLTTSFLIKVCGPWSSDINVWISGPIQTSWTQIWIVRISPSVLNAKWSLGHIGPCHRTVKQKLANSEFMGHTISVTPTHSDFVSTKAAIDNRWTNECRCGYSSR